MSQASIPIWFQMIVGGGGLIGISAFIFNLVREAKDVRDQHIQQLKDKVESLKESHEREVSGLQRELQSKKEELERVGDFRQLLESAVSDLEREGVTAENNASLRKIESYLITIEKNREHLASSQTAASWVRHKKEEWLHKTLDAAIRDCSQLIPKNKLEEFEKEIASYLQWLYDSLQFGFFCKIDDYVKVRSIKEPFPYRAALKELQKIRDFGQLSNAEAQYLQEYIEELIRRTTL